MLKILKGDQSILVVPSAPLFILKDQRKAKDNDNSSNLPLKKNQNSGVQLKFSFSCKFLTWSRKLDVHTFEGKREESLKFWLLRCSTIQTTKIHRHQLKVSWRPGRVVTQIWMKAFYSGEFDVLTRKQITQPAAHFRLSSPTPAAVSISLLPKWKLRPHTDS